MNVQTVCLGRSEAFYQFWSGEEYCGTTNREHQANGWSFIICNKATAGKITEFLVFIDKLYFLVLYILTLLDADFFSSRWLNLTWLTEALEKAITVMY